MWQITNSGFHFVLILDELNAVMEGKSGNSQCRFTLTLLSPCSNDLGAFATPSIVERRASFIFIMRGKTFKICTSCPSDESNSAWSATKVPRATLSGKGKSRVTSKIRMLDHSSAW